MSTAANLIDMDTVKYVHRMLFEDPFDEDTREYVRGILMEALSSRFDVDEYCDRLVALLDGVCTTNNKPIPIANDIILKISQLFTATTAKDSQVIKYLITFVKLLEEDTVEDIFVVLMEDPFD